MSEKIIECEGFTFLSNFDSANLARVEFVPKKLAVTTEITGAKQTKKITNNRKLQRKPKPVEFPDYEFNIWTSPDCAGTEYENSNRTWFYFGITGGTVFSLVKLNIIDLNKQSKMYSQGMAPVYRVVPGKCQWERIHDKPVFSSDNNIFTISFKFRTTENVTAVTYFAFTYPFSYTELQNYLSSIDLKMSKQENHFPKPEIKFNKGLKISNDINDAIYYHRETLCYSLDHRIIDLITISSHHNITSEREPRLQTLFPDENIPRAFKFQDKKVYITAFGYSGNEVTRRFKQIKIFPKIFPKVVFISARVHPGETPSSFVMNGIINLLIQKDNPIAILLRRQFVFKLIPMLNPDGVALGHYRTDTRGCNLNRYYLNPSRELHPSIYGARALIRYHHCGEETEDEDYRQEKYDVYSQADPIEFSDSELSSQENFHEVSPKTNDILNNTESVESDIAGKEQALLSMDLLHNSESLIAQTSSSSIDCSIKTVSRKPSSDCMSKKDISVNNSVDELSIEKDESKKFKDEGDSKKPKAKVGQDSGLFLYLDMHGHASKKGVFMYGNHFEKVEDSVECMLFPKLMSVNSQNFHFSACNFTEKNMYLRDKRDGTSREGSGRVAVLRLTGLIRSYTLECNYNTGRFVNKLPQCCRELPGKINSNLLVPPKYSPVVYEEIGRSICISILDLTNSNPWSRIPNSEYHTLLGIRDWLRIRNLTDNFLYHRPISKQLRTKAPSKSSQTQVMIGVLRSDVRQGKRLSNVLLAPLHSKQSINVEHSQDEMERKENVTTFRGESCSALMVNRKEAGPSHSKRSTARVSSVLQVRGGASRPIKSLKKTIYRGGDKIQKFKQFIQKSEGSSEEPLGEADSKVTACEGERRLKLSSVSDQCFFKQSPKRLKISKGDEGTKLKSEWCKEDAIPGPSSSDIVLYSRLNRSVGSAEGLGKMRIAGKVKQQIPPMKFKKSLEKRRGSDASRKKSKTLFKKAGKIILTNDTNKNMMKYDDRKRRKN